MNKNIVCLCCVKLICVYICEFGVVCLLVLCIGQYLYVQVFIVDGLKVLVVVNIIQIDIKEGLKNGKNVDVVVKVGCIVVECVKVVGIEKVVFDCLGYCYYGCIKVLVEVVCEVGLQF